MTALTQPLAMTVVLDPVICCECGVTFGMDRLRIARLRETHKNFWCPGGHVQFFPGSTEPERLKRRLESAEAQLTHVRDQRDATERSLRTTRGHVTRLRNAAAAGQCPVDSCGKTFLRLATHMSAKHPGYAEADLTTDAVNR